MDIQKNQFAKQLKDQEMVSSPFLIKYSAVQVGKTGKPYMNLVLMDRTGEVEARIWEDVPQVANHAVQDAFVMIDGKCQLFQGRKQVVIKKIQVLREDQIETKDFIAEGTVDVESEYQKLVSYVDSMEDPDYKTLARSILIEDESIVQLLKKAPAAKSVHHAYRGGLLEHMVSITGMLDFISGHYGRLVCRDLLFLGGFFHDIGKIWELSYDRTTDYTTEGRLIGHLVMGVELIERKVHEIHSKGSLPHPFPEEKKLLIKHVILAHHGRLEYGSPKRPKCLEALIVHMIDDLDSKVNSISQFVKNDENPGRWTGLHRHYERFFYKPDWAMENFEN